MPAGKGAAEVFEEIDRRDIGRDPRHRLEEAGDVLTEESVGLVRPLAVGDVEIGVLAEPQALEARPLAGYDQRPERGDLVLQHDRVEDDVARDGGAVPVAHQGEAAEIAAHDVAVGLAAAGGPFVEELRPGREGGGDLGRISPSS